MSRIFILTVLFVFLTIFGESINLLLQLKGQKLTRWIGDKAFTIHMAITGSLWIISFLLILILQFEKHPLFHESIILQCIGLILTVSGSFLALWAFKLLGLKRSLCLNFFREDVPLTTRGPYNCMRNPMDYGLWMTLIGFALLTGSLYNLVIAVESILIMIPHMILENVPVKIMQKVK